MAAVEEGEPLHRRVRELVEHVGELGAGLLVLPGAGEVHGHVDLAHQLREVAGVGVLRPVDERLAELLEVDVLLAQPLVLGADRVAVVDALLDPGGAAGRRLPVALGEPLAGEAAVVDAAGPLLQPRVLDHREGGDGREVRRLGRRRVELGDARVGQADHAGLVVQDPVLAGDRLDDVVAVGLLGGVEHVEHAARAARAAHVDADGGVAEQAGDEGAGLGGIGVRRAVARVLDDGRVRALVGRAGQAHVDAELLAVAHGDVAEPGLVGALGTDVALLEVVERRARVVVQGMDPELPRDLHRPGVLVADGVHAGAEAVALTGGQRLARARLVRAERRWEVGEVGLAVLVGLEDDEPLPALVDQGQPIAGGDAGDRDLLGPGPHVEGGRRGRLVRVHLPRQAGRHGGDGRRRQHGDGDRASAWSAFPEPPCDRPLFEIYAHLCDV